LHDFLKFITTHSPGSYDGMFVVVVVLFPLH